ncbi:MAG: hypothetical protein GEU88_18585 [Solirubrobacterales bacterium]|nr:hypothetical protein [Solirubrobacterales bacterium]
MRGSPFFEGVRQVELTYAGESTSMPIFYYEGSAITALFAARLGALRRLLPDPGFVPARLAPGLGVVGVSAFEYRDTDIGPYNELAVSVILNHPPHLANAPGRALARALRRRQIHAYVHHLPVTTEVARVGGIDFYAYPKFIAAIDFSEEDDGVACRLAEGAAHILTLRGRRTTAARSREMQVFSHLWMDRQPQSAELKLNALELGMTSRPGSAELELGSGEHPISHELARLLVGRRAFHYQRMPSFEAILYGPEHLTLPLLERAREATAASPARAA